MKVNPVDINQPQRNNESFGSGIVIKVPKTLYPSDWTEGDVANHVNQLISIATSSKKRSFKDKFLDFIGKKPEIVGFMHYPGYECIGRYLKNGRTWVESRLNFKYNLSGAERLDIQVPEIDEHDYNLFFLTNKERDKFILNLPDKLKKSKSETDKVKQYVSHFKSTSMEAEDVEFVKALNDAYAYQQSFEDAVSGDIYAFNVDNFDEISAILSQV